MREPIASPLLLAPAPPATDGDDVDDNDDDDDDESNTISIHRGGVFLRIYIRSSLNENPVILRCVRTGYR